MQVKPTQICGPWAQGWILDKHTASSTFLGHDANGRAQFNNVRTEAGEATYQLKYKRKFDRAPLLAKAVAESICPKLADIGFIVPMPASKARARQPVTEVARELGTIINVPVFDDLLIKTPTGKSLKDLGTKDEKLAEIGSSMSVNDRIGNAGRWNVLLLDDLFDSGASMEKATQALKGYAKVLNVYVAALTRT